MIGFNIAQGGVEARLPPHSFFAPHIYNIKYNIKGEKFGVKKDAKKNDFLVKNFAFFGNVY